MYFVVVFVLIVLFFIGVCNGINIICVGCDGILNSGLVKDVCGVCGGDGLICIEIMVIML